MIDRKYLRRTILGLALAGGVDAVLETQGTGVVTSVYRLANWYEQREYDATCAQIRAVGIPIDPLHSRRAAGSRGQIIFLPDIHSKPYQSDQCERIKKLDGLPLRAIGLEGMIGPVDLQLLDEQDKAHRQAGDALVIDTFIDRYRPEDWPILPTDHPLITLQKQYKHLDLAIDMLRHIPKYQEDFKLRNPSCESSRQFENDLRDLRCYIPSVFRSFENISPYEDLYLPLTATRMHAPGRAYCRLPTRAPKIGIESAQHDRQAVQLVTAMGYHTRMLALDESLAKVRSSFVKVQEHYGMFAQFDLLALRFAEFVEAVQHQREEFNRAIGPVLVGLPAQVESEIRQLKKDQLVTHFKQIVDQKRSEEWVQNCADMGGIVLLVGGQGHTDTVFAAAQDKNVSIITAQPLEKK